MDVRRLQYFIAVAEEMSFSGAAKRLNISQPPLSQQIRTLEDELGCRLFDRSQRRIRLTAPGAVLLTEAKYLLSRHEAIAKLVAHASVAGETVVTMGFVNSALVGFAPSLLKWMRNQMPFVHPDLKHIQSGAQFDAIAQDRLDIGFLRVPEAPPGFSRVELPGEELCIAVPSEHPLAARPSVSFAEAAGEDVVLYARHLAPAEFDNIVGQSERRGVGLHIAREVDTGTTVLPYVASGAGVSFVASLATRQTLEGVVFKRLDPPAFAAPLAVVARSDNANPAIQEIVDASVRIASDIMRANVPMSAGHEPPDR